MPVASHTKVLEADPDCFWEAIVDYKAYPEWADNVVGTRVLKQEEGGARVKFFLKLIKEFNYTLDLHHDYPNRVWWQLVRGDLFHKMDGAWDLKRKGRKLEVTYTADIDAKLHIPGFIVKRLVGFNLPRVIDNFHERALLLQSQR